MNEGQRTIASFVRSLAVVGFAALLSACALSPEKKAAVSSFGSASKTLGTLVSKEITAVRDDVIKMNSERIQLEGEKKDLPGVAELDKDFGRSNVAKVTKLANALASYGATLSSLVDDTETAALNKSATDFVASVAAAPGVSGSLSTEQQGAIGTIIKAVGGFWIESKRKRAVEVVVRESKAAIDSSCDLLIKDFGEDGWITMSLSVQSSELNRASKKLLFDAKNYQDRALLLANFKLAEQNDYRFSTVLASIRTAATDLKKSNAELHKAIEEKDWTLSDIQAFAASVASLRSAIELIR
jgi:hypothetical protein